MARRKADENILEAQAVEKNTMVVKKETSAGAPEPSESAVKKAASKKTDVKKSGSKEPVFKTIVQVGNKEFDITDIAAAAYKAYKSVHKRKTVTDFVVYIKPEESAAYYTVNGEGSDEYKIDL